MRYIPYRRAFYNDLYVFRAPLCTAKDRADLAVGSDRSDRKPRRGSVLRRQPRRFRRDGSPGPARAFSQVPDQIPRRPRVYAGEAGRIPADGLLRHHSSGGHRDRPEALCDHIPEQMDDRAIGFRRHLRRPRRRLRRRAVQKTG